MRPEKFEYRSPEKREYRGAQKVWISRRPKSLNIGAPEKFEYRGAPKSLNVGAPEKFEYRGAPKSLNIGRPKNVSAQELNKHNRFFYSCFVFGKSFCKGKSCRKLPRRTGRRRLLRRCREKILLREILQQGGACPMKNDWNTSSAQELNKNNRFFYLCFVFLKSGWAAAKIYSIK
jgi:hypothetical protein